MNLIFSGLKTYFIRGRARPEVPPVESNSSSCISKDKNLVLQTDAITEMAQVICKWSETKSNNFGILELQAKMAKSLPSLSSYLSAKGRSAVIQIDHNDQLGGSHCDKRKFRDNSEENVTVVNGSKSNAFKTATQKYAMIPSNLKKKKYKQNSVTSDGSSNNETKQKTSLPESANYANLLNRRYSHSLPSLPPSQEYGKRISHHL